MKLHWSPRSPFVRKVMVCAHELGMADRLEIIRSPVAITAPNHDLMRDNPLSKIPTLITDDGMRLFDSLVICEYLDAQAGQPRLFPARGPERWRALRWHALGNCLLDMLILFRNERDRPEAGRSKAHLDAYLEKTLSTLNAMEREEISGLTNAPLSIGHITIGIALGYLNFRFGDLAWRDGRPEATAWYASFAERASMKATVPVDA
ncbi:MAG: glutathione S-transferase [Betaproteobacteria bacterium]|nr:glutathione S-transferase [Betaproteobacteria bacterium]